jgi:hypothetical protein
MDDAVQHTAVVDAPGTGLIVGQQRLDHRPLPIGKPEQPGHDPSSDGSQLESRQLQYVNMLIGFGAWFR